MSPLRTPRTPTRTGLDTGQWLLVAASLFLWFVALGYRDLIHPDEGRYAEIARAMFTSGDWITPRLNGILYFEKPALQYWATALAFSIFGLNEFAARFWPAASGVLAVLALALMVRSRLGTRAALTAGTLLVSCTWWIGNGHFLNLDMSLAFFMTLTMLGFWRGQQDDASPAERRACMSLAWAAMAGAILSKGLVGIVLPGAVLVAYTVLARDLRVWARLGWWPGLPIFLVLVVPWFVLVSQRNPGFAHFFFVHEHFERFLTTTHRRTGAWWYFLPLLALGMLPWTSLLPGALWRGWKRQAGQFQPNRFLVIWAVLIFLFFSASSSKLPSYILPIFPALALLCAQHLLTLSGRRLSWHAALAALLAAATTIAVPVATEVLARQSAAPRDIDLAYRSWIIAGFAVIAAGGVLAWWLARRERSFGAIAALALASLLGVQLILSGHQTYASLRSARQMVETIRPVLGPDWPVYSVATYDQTLPFYLGRPVTVVQWKDELAMGLDVEPERWIPDLAGFEERWRTGAPAAALMRLGDYERFEQAGLPMQVVYRDPTRVVVVTPR